MKLVKKLSIFPKNPINTEAKVISTPKYTDLRQVMDYTRDFSMFYSGVEYEVYLDGCYNMGIRNFLMSYEYLRTKGAGNLKKYSDMHLFIDSGAFTYMSDPKYSDYTEEQWEKQIEQYLSWAKKHKDAIFGMAELDLQLLVGLDTVNRWRKKHFEPFMLETGIPVCFIYHNEGEDIWKQMCQRYPYVGFSSAAEDDGTRSLHDYKGMLRVAEKYESLVHGFGMTRTSMLPELPFYTVDSTSWKAGFRYGLLSVWNGKKVQQFPKEEWQQKVYPITRAYKDITFDEKLLEDFNEPEVLRASVYAYQRAEEFIIDRQKSILYWKKAKAVVNKLEDLPPDFFPSHEWFTGSKSDYMDYAKKMNINPEGEKEWVKDTIADMTAFLNFDKEEYTFLSSTYLTKAEGETACIVDDLHDLYVNRIVPSEEAKVSDLIEFYTQCLEGTKDTLLLEGTNFDRIVKERDSYIEEDEYVEAEVPKEEMNIIFSRLLPPASDGSPAPEIDSLDDEIFKDTGIVPVRDEQGKFLKGVRQERAIKKVYSKKYPKYACDTCFNAQKCPEYKAGYVCAYDKMFSRFNTRDMTDIIQGMQGIVEHNMTRMQKAMLDEVMQGGAPNGVVTSLMEQNIRYMTMLKNMYEGGSAEVLKQTKVIRADGTQETTTSITNPQGGGILEKLFSGKRASPENDLQEDGTIEVTPAPKRRTVNDTVEDEYAE